MSETNVQEQAAVLAIVKGQVWHGIVEHRVLSVTSEVIWYRDMVWLGTGRVPSKLKRCTWTEWRDWQQRHAAQPQPQSEASPK